MVLENLSKWTPFRIDALGLVTMLGAEEVDKALGRLIKSPLTDYLPLLGAFVIAGNRFVQPVVGFTLYNISDGILATDVSGWLSRWLINQDLAWNTSTFIWSVRQTPRSVWKDQVSPVLVGFVMNTGLMVFSVLLGDWWGLANAIAMTISVYVRWYLVQQNCNFLDEQVASLTEYETQFVKCFCLLASGKAVTLFAPRGLVTGGFLTTPRPQNRLVYNLTRAMGWVGFSCHVISIGQSTLFIQILSVVIMILATVLCVLGVGCDEFKICRRVSVYPVKSQHPGDNRSLAYAQLALSEVEESAMLAWGLFPQQTNYQWWIKYGELKMKCNPVGLTGSKVMTSNVLVVERVESENRLGFT